MSTYHQWMEVVTPATLAGLPALSVPVGFSLNGLPTGMQLIGRRGDDSGVLESPRRTTERRTGPDNGHQPSSLASSLPRRRMLAVAVARAMRVCATATASSPDTLSSNQHQRSRVA